MIDNILWFQMPANCWEEVLPVGNGSLGGMIWGTIKRERIGLNLDTLWSGYPRDTNNYSAKKYLEPVRQEIFKENYVKASAMVEEHLLGEFMENYLPMGDLWIENETDLEETREEKKEEGRSHYKRELNLNEAVAKVTYEENNVNYSRTYFASYVDKAIAMEYKSSKKVNYKISLESQLKGEMRFVDNGWLFLGQCPEHVEPSYLPSDDPIIYGNRGIRFKTQLKVKETDGIVSYDNGSLFIQGATYFVAYVQSVSGNREDPFTLGEFKEIKKSFKKCRMDHLKDYQNLFQRVELFLGEPINLPTDKRLEGLKAGEKDPALYSLFFQYGRYLLISSSRQGSEAANLQGIWNWEMRAPWSSNYTTNINLEMNYWPAQICNLEECMEPYFTLLSHLVEKGSKTANIHFGCRGFCVGHNSDYWCGTNPVGIPKGQNKGVAGSSQYAFFVLSGQWMCQELWKAYEYHKNIAFLAEYAYPILKKSVLFLIDWLVEYKGYYVTCPSSSPENQFMTECGAAPISMGSTIDMSIVRESFDHFKKAYKELCNLHRLPKDTDDINSEQLYQQVEQCEERLLPFQIGKDGRLQEWIYPFTESEPGHRHISHAYGLFPGSLFREDETLKRACEKAICYRLEHGGGHTGWSCAWIANLFAVLEDGQKAYTYMNTLLTKSLCKNMWTSHPPFQIDANFAGIMAMAQMFVQERADGIKVLPAIPKEWRKGYVKGLCLKDNKTIDIHWENGVVRSKVYEMENN